MEYVSFDEDPDSVVVNPLQPNKWRLVDWMIGWGMARTTKAAERLLLISSIVILLAAAVVALVYLVPHTHRTVSTTLVPISR